jgi:hypothetical protein
VYPNARDTAILLQRGLPRIASILLLLSQVIHRLSDILLGAATMQIGQKSG